MSPDPGIVLKTFAEILQNSSPNGPGAVSYEGQQLLRMAPLLNVLALEYDRAAARRVEENQALGKLFGTAVPLVNDYALK